MKLEFLLLLANGNEQLATLYGIALGVDVSELVFWIHPKKERSRSDEKRVKWEPSNLICAIIQMCAGSQDSNH